MPAAITRNELAGVDDHAEPIADAGEAISWFTGQQAVLHAVLELAEESGMDAHAEQLAWAMAAYHDRRG